MFVVAIGVLLAETWRRQNLYWYPVQRDQTFAFTSPPATVLDVHVTSQSMGLPEAARGRTALLEIQLASRLTGWWFEPCIEITADARRETQCFERGARGVRHVLLTGELTRGTGSIALHGRHLRWAAQDARLTVFEPLDLAGARVLVLAPHPDDAEIAAFGLYSSHESWVATMTAGNYVDGLYGALPLDAAGQDAWRGEVRVWDSLAVPQLGGVAADRVVNLGYVTHSLREFHEAARAGTPEPAAGFAPVPAYRQGAVATLLDGRAAHAHWDSVVQDLVALVGAVRPDVIVAPHPGLDIAADHQYTTVALLEALAALGDTTTTLLLYTNHHVLAEHYPFGPSTAQVTVPPWFGGLRFDGLRSHPLDAQAQLRKLFALESMHDLRAPPSRVDEGPLGVLWQRIGEGARIVRRDPLGDYTYFRRAVRPNELFFSYRPQARPSVDEAVAAAELTRSPPP